MTELSTCVCSITVTQRKRYFWAAWWTGAPTERPFRHPDASNGGAASAEEALAEAERLAGRHLVVIEPYWARAWTRVMRGEPAPRRAVPRPRAVPARLPELSAWAILELPQGAPLDDIKRAYRTRARATHPDHGGDADEFRRVQRAYERLATPSSASPRKKR
ncbi:MAG: J domain-containing protein [Proteobacteria bacterium]|nr:J domain-containing protein [Pseudomonadota bacterium]